MIETLDHVYIIAEIGINHEGNADNCAKMIRAASEIGADAVKLQTIDADKNYVTGTLSHSIFKKAELSIKETTEMFELAKSLGLDIFTTAGDIETIKWVEELNPAFWKISSGLLTHTPIVEFLALLGRPLIISTGMASIEDIDEAIRTILNQNNKDITILQCTSIYPTPIDAINLSTINWLQNRYKCRVGFSDHSLGDDAVFLSIGAGASVIEKHISLDPNRKGFDHNISLDVCSFSKMIKRVRNAEKMMGLSEKALSDEIIEVRQKYLRSIVAIESISKGNLISANNVGVKRTKPMKNGSPPKYLKSLFGKIAKKDYQVNEPINTNDFE